MRHYLTQFLSHSTPVDGANNDVSVWWVRARNSVDKNGMPIAKKSFPIVWRNLAFTLFIVKHILSVHWAPPFRTQDVRLKTLESQNHFFLFV